MLAAGISEISEGSFVPERRGTLIADRYRIDRLIGVGGFAAVYRAQDRLIGETVAIKILELPDRQDDAHRYVRRFLREATIGAEVRHPNVVAVFDHGILDGGRPYLVMEPLDGHDLDTEFEHRDRVEPGRAIRLVCGALDGLEIAHARGIVHKDLKPSNLFIVWPGTTHERMVVLDFGVAGLVDGMGTRITRTGGFAGTASYFAPEYAQHGKLSAQVDVYQMGLILAEMLTGYIAVSADTLIAMVLKHANGEWDIPEGLFRGTFGKVLRRATSPDPKQRFGSAGTFADALRRLAPRDYPVIVTKSEVHSRTLDSQPTVVRHIDAVP